ncbi:hypothetical protein AHF37_08760 [Paragonimus kellicotti]|nr:hypothetical protein AHF37_08760 [Paragonimus kellicotti]
MHRLFLDYLFLNTDLFVRLSLCGRSATLSNHMDCRISQCDTPINTLSSLHLLRRVLFF